MRIALLTISLFLSVALFGQDEKRLYGFGGPDDKGLEMPTFKGGLPGLSQFLATNIKYPQAAKEKGVQGMVFITFIVEMDGSLTNVSLLQGIGGGCDEEAMRVVRAMDGYWTPGKKDGEVVRVQFNLPVKFTLTGGTKAGGHTDSGMSFNKGVKLLNKKKYDNATMCFEIYQPGDVLYPDAQYNLGVCYYFMEDYKEAIKYWEEALKYDVSDCKSMLAESYSKMGQDYQAREQWPAAIGCFTKSLEYVPGDALVKYERAIAYLKIGDKEKACQDLNEIPETDELKKMMEETCGE